MTTLETPETPAAPAAINNNWPAQDDLDRFYGRIEYGIDGEPTERWEARALQRLSTPFGLKLAWRPEQTIRRIRVNRNCIKSLSRIFNVLEKLRLEYGDLFGVLDVETFGGCYLPGSRATPELMGPHAYGAAIRLGVNSPSPEIIEIFAAEQWRQVKLGAGLFAAIS